MITNSALSSTLRFLWVFIFKKCRNCCRVLQEFYSLIVLFLKNLLRSQILDLAALLALDGIFISRASVKVWYTTDMSTFAALMWTSFIFHTDKQMSCSAPQCLHACSHSGCVFRAWSKMYSKGTSVLIIAQTPLWQRWSRQTCTTSRSNSELLRLRRFRASLFHSISALTVFLKQHCRQITSCPAPDHNTPWWCFQVAFLNVNNLKKN